MRISNMDILLLTTTTTTTTTDDEWTRFSSFIPRRRHSLYSFFVFVIDHLVHIRTNHHLLHANIEKSEESAEKELSRLLFVNFSSGRKPFEHLSLSAGVRYMLPYPPSRNNSKNSLEPETALGKDIGDRMNDDSGSNATSLPLPLPLPSPTSGSSKASRSPSSSSSSPSSSSSSAHPSITSGSAYPPLAPGVSPSLPPPTNIPYPRPTTLMNKPASINTNLPVPSKTTASISPNASATSPMNDVNSTIPLMQPGVGFVKPNDDKVSGNDDRNNASQKSDDGSANFMSPMKGIAMNQNHSHENKHNDNTVEGEMIKTNHDLGTPLSSSQKRDNDHTDSDAVIDDIYRISQIAELKRKLNELRRTPSKHYNSNASTPKRGEIHTISKHEFESLTQELRELRRSVELLSPEKGMQQFTPMVSRTTPSMFDDRSGPFSPIVNVANNPASMGTVSSTPQKMSVSNDKEEHPTSIPKNANSSGGFFSFLGWCIRWIYHITILSFAIMYIFPGRLEGIIMRVIPHRVAVASHGVVTGIYHHHIVPRIEVLSTKLSKIDKRHVVMLIQSFALQSSHLLKMLLVNCKGGFEVGFQKVMSLISSSTRKETEPRKDRFADDMMQENSYVGGEDDYQKEFERQTEEAIKEQRIMEEERARSARFEQEQPTHGEGRRHPEKYSKDDQVDKRKASPTHSPSASPAQDPHVSPSHVGGHPHQPFTSQRQQELQEEAARRRKETSDRKQQTSNQQQMNVSSSNDHNHTRNSSTNNHIGQNTSTMRLETNETLSTSSGTGVSYDKTGRENAAVYRSGSKSKMVEQEASIDGTTDRSLDMKANDKRDDNSDIQSRPTVDVMGESGRDDGSSNQAEKRPSKLNHVDRTQQPLVDKFGRRKRTPIEVGVSRGKKSIQSEQQQLDEEEERKPEQKGEQRLEDGIMMKGPEVYEAPSKPTTSTTWGSFLSPSSSIKSHVHEASAANQFDSSKGNDANAVGKSSGHETLISQSYEEYDKKEEVSSDVEHSLDISAQQHHEIHKEHFYEEHSHAHMERKHIQNQQQEQQNKGDDHDGNKLLDNVIMDQVASPPLDSSMMAPPDPLPEKKMVYGDNAPSTPASVDLRNDDTAETTSVSTEKTTIDFIEEIEEVETITTTTTTTTTTEVVEEITEEFVSLHEIFDDVQVTEEAVARADSTEYLLSHQHAAAGDEL